MGEIEQAKDVLEQVGEEIQKVVVQGKKEASPRIAKVEFVVPIGMADVGLLRHTNDAEQHPEKKIAWRFVRDEAMHPTAIIIPAGEEKEWVRRKCERILYDREGNEIRRMKPEDFHAVEAQVEEFRLRLMKVWGML